MQGYGYPPQQPKRGPSSATLTALRVVFVALTLLSCGFLSWAALLRLAIVTRKGLDWILMAGVVAGNAAMFVYIISTPDDQEELTDTQALVFLGWMICSVVGTITYYLYTEIRHFSRQSGYPGASPYGYVPPQAPAAGFPAPTPGYGYPPPPAVPTRTPAPTPPTPTPPTPPAPTPPPAPAPTAPQTKPASPQRLDQVRAELDELSDYLRKEGGNR
jgi:hypothetical protein